MASGAAALALTGQLSKVVAATAPAVQALAPGTGGLLLQAGAAALLGSAVAVGAGAVVGARVAHAAANGATRPDITQGPAEQKNQSPYRQYAAELRENVSGVASAESFKGAAGAGFRAGVAIGGPAGAAAGKIQGALLGAALGGVAALPLMNLVPHPAALIPGALAGALLGAKIGEPVGYAAGALTLGAAGAVGGAACHVFHRKADQA